MKTDIKPGLEYELVIPVSGERTVPALLPESDEFKAMPQVLATGYMVGLIELACIKCINPCLDWPREMTVGTHIDVSHIAATPPGLTVRIKVRLINVEGRKLCFAIEARDDVDLISKGTHERFIIYPDKFNRKVREKAAAKA